MTNICQLMKTLWMYLSFFHLCRARSVSFLD
uniref:Uncharacterized protein n=1 Tax=Anguilla anguilla TaxID=7936 RepID=A0A0E9TE30_ANGAN